MGAFRRGRRVDSFQGLGDEDLSRCLEELVRACRHAAVGRRVRALVHRVNTPLQVLSFQLELLEQKAVGEETLLERCSPPIRAELENLRRYRLEKLHQFRLEVEKLQGISRRLLVQGLHEEGDEGFYLDLNQVFREELEFYRAELRQGQRVDWECRFVPLPPIYGHYVDFSLSLRHLVENALEAMEAAPRRVLTLSTRLEGSEGGGKACRVLEVADTGHGIPPELLGRLLEPFVTTRDTAAAPRAGLGLFLVRRLLAPYGAEFQVESRPGDTRVLIRLPV